MKKRTEITESMYDELMRVYREVAGSCNTQVEAYERSVRHSAPRYYVDARWAYQVIYPMLSGDISKLEMMSDMKREMYKSLFGVVMDLSQKRDFWGKSAYYIVQFAVLQPAPRFYISSESMRKIFRKRRLKKIRTVWK